MFISADYNCKSLTDKSGDELEIHYSKLLRELGSEKGMLGQIFTKSQTKYKTLPSCINSLPSSMRSNG